MNAPNVRERASVRWPFRILATLIVLACVVAVVGNLVAGWQYGMPVLKWQFFAALPGAAWFVRLALYAAIHGKVPASAHWPFASENVLLWYAIVFAFISHA